MRMPPSPAWTVGERSTSQGELSALSSLCGEDINRVKVVRSLEALLRKSDAKAIVYDNGGAPMSVSDKRNAFVWDLGEWRWMEELRGVALGEVSNLWATCGHGNVRVQPVG